jgi:hypothetical protein
MARSFHVRHRLKAGLPTLVPPTAEWSAVQVRKPSWLSRPRRPSMRSNEFCEAVPTATRVPEILREAPKPLLPYWARDC